MVYFLTHERKIRNNKKVLHNAMIEEGFDLLAMLLTQGINTYTRIVLVNMIKWVK